MIGTRLGQYRIDALLGQGGMGAVYLATDEMLGRQVAIKVLREGADTEGNAADRFRSEAQILSRLDHPHILRLHGFSQHDGALYMVTEFVKGEALQRRLERAGAVPATQVLEWACQVLDALEYAHHLGVVHRDIKPANILIDERNRARLLDFGIARIVGTEGPTMTGHAVGTLTYMAPEQVLDEPVDGRADLYAFAIVLCQMFAGRRPYRATTTAGLIREIVDGPVADVATMLPPLAAAFAPVLTHALARQPADRTPTAGQMRAELQAAAAPALPPLPLPTTPAGAQAPSTGVKPGEHSPVTARSAPVPPPATQRRRPGAIAYLVPAVLVLAAVGLGWYLFGPNRLVTPRVAMAPPQTARGDAPPSRQEAAPSPAEPSAPAPGSSGVPALQEPPPAAAGAPPGPAPVVRPAPTASPRATGPSRRGAPAPPAALPAPDERAVESNPATPSPVTEAVPPPPATPPAPAAVPATIEFKDIILIDRVDDEDEELDVSMRLDARRVVVIDEDGLAKRSVAYDAIGRASYNTKRPGRFSLRRGPSHWLTLEVGTTPIVLRLNGRTYEQVLTTLAGHGVPVERNP